jgi:hypothetical protein
VIERHVRTLITTNQCKWLVQQPYCTFVRAWTSNGKLKRPCNFTGLHKCIHKIIESRRCGRGKLWRPTTLIGWNVSSTCRLIEAVDFLAMPGTS